MIWLRNIASNYLRFITSLMVMAVMTPVIIHSIGVTAYGEWAIVFAAIGLVSLSDLGFATAAIKFLAEAAVESTERLQEVTGSLLMVYAGVTLLCGVIVAAVFGAGVMPLDQVFLLLGVSTTFIMATSVHRAFLIAIGRQETVNWITILGTLLQAMLTWKLLDQGFGVLGMALAHAVSMSGQAVLFTLLASAHRFPLPSVHGLGEHIGQIASFSVWALIANVCFMLILRVDPLLIEVLMNPEAVALFAIALKVGEQILLFNKQFSNALLPLISQRQAADQKSGRAALLIFSTRYLMVFAAPITLLLAFNAEDLLVLWIGQSVAGASLSLGILAVAVLGSTMQFNAANIVGMSGHPRYVAMTMVGSAFVKVALGCLLMLHFGIAGAAVGTLVAALCVEAARNIYKACELTAVPLKVFIHRSLLPGLICTLPAGVLALVDAPAENLLSLVVSCGAYGMLSLLIFGLIFVSQEDKQFFQNFFHNRETPSCAPSIAS